METTTKDVHSFGDNYTEHAHKWCIFVVRNVVNILGKPQSVLRVSGIKEALENRPVSLLGLSAKIK